MPGSINPTRADFLELEDDIGKANGSLSIKGIETTGLYRVFILENHNLYNRGYTVLSS